MKFLLATGIFPPEIGGPATVVASLAQELKQHGHDVVVVTYGESPSENGVIHVSRRGNALSRYFRFLRAVRLRLSPETIVLATDVFSVGIPIRAALIGRKNKLAVRLGGEWCWEDAVTKGRTRLPLRAFWKQSQPSLRLLVMKWNYRWILARASRVFVTSDLLTHVLSSFLPSLELRWKTIPNVPSPRQNEKRSDEAPHVPLRLLYVGRFAPVKNVPFLAGVLKKLVEAGEDILCTFVGDGEEMDAVKKMLSGVQGMSFVGPKTQQEIAPLLLQSDALVLPSLTDICPNSVVEALSYGVPVIMTSEHGLSSGFHGFVTCSPTDKQAWMTAIRSLRDAEAYGVLRSLIAMPTAPSHKLIDELTVL